jgi:vitamin B12 transporter
MFFLNSVRNAPGVRSAVAGAVVVVLAGGFAGGFAGAAWAAEQVMEPVVVTASRVPQPLSQVLADVTVVTREDIEQQGYGDLATLLSRQGGLEFDRNGGPGTSTGIFMRGANSRFTAVLIDGVRIDSQGGQGGASFGGLPLSSIDHIEIVRGPASTIYGSDAVAGVIQIFTRQGGEKPVSMDVGLSVGSRHLVKWDANLSGSEQALSYALSFAHEGSTGQSTLTNPSNFYFNADKDGYKSRQWAGRVGLKVNADHRVEVSSSDSRINAQFDAGSLLDPRSSTVVTATSAQWLAQWSPMLRGTYLMGESTDQTHIPVYDYDTATRGRTISALHDLQLAKHGFHLILERRTDQVTEGSPSAHRAQNGLGLGYDWQDNGYALQIKTRHEADSEFGNHDTGSLSAAFEPVKGWRVRSSLATAFRAPTLNERFYGPGNPGLIPETSRNAEVAVDWHQGLSRASVSVYRNRIRNLIDYDFPSDSYKTVGAADLRGLALTGKTALDGWRFTGSVDFQNPKNSLTDLLLVRRARQHASLSVEREVAGWTLGSQLVASGMRFDGTGNTQRLPGYALVNLYAQSQVTKQWNFLVRLDNVLNKSYETARDYGMPGFSGLVAVRFTPSN